MATKRVNGEGCIRKKDATHWEARITLSRDPVTKKQKIKAFYGKTLYIVNLIICKAKLIRKRINRQISRFIKAKSLLLFRLRYY